MLWLYFLPLLAYLLGSVPSAVAIPRVMGLEDPRDVGSRNPGATNILRYCGRRAGLLPLGVGLALIGTWVLVAVLFRYSSLSALTASLAAPLYVAWLSPGAPYLITMIVMSAILVFRHRSTIRHLIAGT